MTRHRHRSVTCPSTDHVRSQRFEMTRRPRRFFYVPPGDWQATPCRRRANRRDRGCFDAAFLRYDRRDCGDGSSYCARAVASTSTRWMRIPAARWLRLPQVGATRVRSTRVEPCGVSARMTLPRSSRAVRRSYRRQQRWRSRRKPSRSASVVISRVRASSMAPSRVGATTPAANAAMERCSPVVHLRRYRSATRPSRSPSVHIRRALFAIAIGR